MKSIFKKIRYLLYKHFGNIFFKIETNRREKINKAKREKTYKLVEKFREFECLLRDIKYPNNDFNKIMSMVLGDIEEFEYIVRKYRGSWKSLKITTFQDGAYRSLRPEARSFSCHPSENDIRRAISINVKSLFVFGSVLVNRLLILLLMYFPRQSDNPSQHDFEKVYYLYEWLETTGKLSEISKIFKANFLLRIKWLHSAMRFYRNNFIEHIRRGYQQGSNYCIGSDEFSLSHYKWEYGEADNERVEKFRKKMESRGVLIPGRTGCRDLVNRYYVQRLFDNIAIVPFDMVKEALEIIGEIGVNSPRPEKLILELETFSVDLFDFMINEINNSDLIKYKTVAV